MVVMLTVVMSVAFHCSFVFGMMMTTMVLVVWVFALFVL